jgi:tRNA (adenine37-N6)-methyltransferase
MHKEKTFQFQAIGIIHTPHNTCEGTPIQPVYAQDQEGEVELFGDYAEGIQDLDGFDRIWLIYAFHHAPSGKIRVVPFRDNREHGVFATRSPSRPNPIGFSCVRLLGIEDRTLRVSGVDMLEGTPLLDIKPYVPEFDSFPDAKAGWLGKLRVNRTHADSRFEQEKTK